MLVTISIKDKQFCIDLMMRQNHSISQMSALGSFLKVRFNSSEVFFKTKRKKDRKKYIFSASLCHLWVRVRVRVFVVVVG